MTQPSHNWRGGLIDDSPVATERLRSVFRMASTLFPFRCDECTSKGFFVSGPHGHTCTICGEKACWGFYTTPRCEAHRTPEQGGDTS